MRVLVAFATWHGSTATIAEAVAQAIRSNEKLATSKGPVAVDVVNLDKRKIDAGALAAYDAVVLGSPIISGMWLHGAMAFGYANRVALAGKPLWLFTVSSVGDTSDVGLTPEERETSLKTRPDVAKLLKLEPRGQKYFAGVLVAQRFGCFLRYFMWASRAADKKDGRDFDDVARWGGAVAEALAAE